MTLQVFPHPGSNGEACNGETQQCDEERKNVLHILRRGVYKQAKFTVARQARA
jgi:hypothetical protein